MKLIKKIVTISTVSLLLLGILLLKSYSFSPDLHIQESGQIVALYGGRQLKQTLIPQYPLTGVELKFKPINTIEHPVDVQIQIANHPSYSARVNTRALKALTWQAFHLPTRLRAQEPVTLSLSAPIASESASVSPVISSLDTYPNGDATLVISRGRSVPPVVKPMGDVAFRPIYIASGWEIAKYYVNRISFGKPLSRVLVMGIGLLWIWSLLGFIGWIGGQLLERWSLLGRLLLIGIVVLSAGLILFYQSVPSFWLHK